MQGSFLICTVVFIIIRFKNFRRFADFAWRNELPHDKTNQRTSGPVNAHLTPGPGIYSNAFIHVYSPRAGADNPLGTNTDVNRKPLSLCPFVASFKTMSLKYDF